MLRRSLLLIAFTFITSITFGQIKFGLKAGVNTIDQDLQNISIFNGTTEEFKLAASNSSYGFHFGMMLNIEVGKLFIQPEILFNSNNVDYKLTNFSDNSLDQIKTEKYQYMDVPLMVGFKIWKLRLNAGPVGHIFINNKSELVEFDSYQEKIDNLTWGYQAGLGIELGKKITLDFRYEGNFSQYGSNITFFGNDYNTDNNPSKLIGTIGFYF